MIPSRTIGSIASLRHGFGLAWLILGTLALPIVAQEEQPGVFGEVIDVRVVNLEVVVTDKDGVRVSGLGPDDFELTVDRQETPIEYFTEVLGGSAVQRETVDGATLPALAPGEDVGTSYLVFVDEFFTVAQQRNRVYESLVAQLPLLGPADRMAVVAFDGTRLDMLSTWSSSVQGLERVFQRARERPAYGLQRRAERRVYEANRRFGSDTISNLSGVSSRLDIEEQQQVDLIQGQVNRMVLAASAALRGFANPPGRKAMLLLSGGWPYNPAMWVTAEPARAIFADDFVDGKDLYRPLIETANRLSYTLYPVDVPGVIETGISAEDRGLTNQLAQADLLVDREREEQTALVQIATQTGGKALLNAANRRAFETAVEDTRSYYWLGFTPTWRGDDEEHKVRVRPRRKGLEIRTRKSFSDLSRRREVTMMVESSLLFGNPPSASPLGVEVQRGQRAGRGKAMVSLQLTIPLTELAFLPQADAWVANTELRIAVLDEDGATSEVPVIPLQLRGAGPPSEGATASYTAQVKMRKKRHDLVVSLYDTASGKILSNRVSVHP